MALHLGHQEQVWLISLFLLCLHRKCSLVAEVWPLFLHNALGWMVLGALLEGLGVALPTQGRAWLCPGLTSAARRGLEVESCVCGPCWGRRHAAALG